MPDNGIIVSETGDPVTLACEITRGSPMPEMTWTRKERKMPTGEDNIRGLSLTYQAVTRHHSGIYICSADNGFGQPSLANLKLDVQRKFNDSVNQWLIFFFWLKITPFLINLILAILKNLLNIF